ncbi:putative ATP-dependent helicase HrpB [Bacteriovorax sp. BSW11_IV]|uniref:ATP-dependent helicase C-terminal domain-containing protein n=1 Tax=Bacteriovorax sp. BSW11_IV TaxID=1353529 RepID=UPI00038A26DD|nr:ATP-dependent helicase C-terminal domain-containing protein [Bacteriovorax sp. BSW11_IV]EQC48699.1 putative ATP-dependent helicase HrpB [Bacteriovorax sp. BSW11_IV]
MQLNPSVYPIDAKLEDIAKALEKSNCLIIKAQTGAGKTTRLPPYLCLESKAKVLVLEPRRLAAKLSAQRCAEIFEEQVGQTVGHHIRFDKKLNSCTKLLFITEGLFLSYLKSDETLSEYSTIILDEFHERNIHTDLALTLIRRLQQTTRPDLKLVIMSATLDTHELENFLDDSIVFDVPGRTFPIDIEYHTADPLMAIENMLKDKRCSHNILVFLPGMTQIRKLERELKDVIDPNINIVPLHSSLSKKEQDLAFNGDDKKIILATNIAETSLTIPNITGVIDIGLERRASFAPWSGMPLLLLEKISKASATQRAGRAGRIQKGIVYRLYSETDFNLRPAFTPAEIKRVELSHFILDLFKIGISSLEELSWFEFPDENNVNKAIQTLELLNAIKKYRLTDLGHFSSDLSLHPRLSAIVYHARNETEEQLKNIILTVCIISEGMLLKNNVEFNENDDDVCDLSIQLDLIKASFWKDQKLADYPFHYIDRKKEQRIIELYTSLCSRFKMSTSLPKNKTDYLTIIPYILKGFPDRIAKKGKGNQYNFCQGRGGRPTRQSCTSVTLPEYIIVLDALEDPKANAAIGTRILYASKVLETHIKELDSSLLTNEKETVFNEKKGTLTITSHLKYGKINISSTTMPPLIPIGEELAQIIKENWPWPFKDISELEIYNRKVSLLNNANIEHNCPLLADDMLELFIDSIIDEKSSYKILLENDLRILIEEQLSATDLYTLENLTPDKITLNNQKTFNVKYDEDTPYIEARIQDLYSVTKHPHILNDTLPLTIKLLSPAERVAQIVRDLPRFWSSSWEQVRKELKSRYPKHYWPQEPEKSDPIRILRK